MHRSILAAAAALALLPLGALAQSLSPPPSASPAEQSQSRSKVRTACAADIQKFCANIERAKGATRTCLASHENELTAGCKAARAERAAERSKSKG